MSKKKRPKIVHEEVEVRKMLTRKGKHTKYASTYTEFSQQTKKILMDLAHALDWGVLKEVTIRNVGTAHKRIMFEYRKSTGIGAR